MNILQDLRFAFRQLRKSLGFTVMGVLTLGIGVGAATAVFSLVDTVLLHPLPFREPERIVALNTMSEGRGVGSGPALPNDTSYPNFFDWRSQAHSFEALASWQGSNFTLGKGNGPAQRIDGSVVSADFFKVLGVQPALGRTFNPVEEQAGNRSVILSNSLWRSAMGANPDAVGKTIQLSDESYTLVGVMPASFRFPNAPDVSAWITPAHTEEGKNPSAKQRGWSQLSVIGRLAPGVSVAEARAEMQMIQQAIARQYPDDAGKETGVQIRSEMEDLTGDVKGPLHILFSAVCFLLLIACANVAGLLLTRTAARRSELALRAALGAKRIQIVRQLLIESLTLSTLGGMLGFAMAAIALHTAPQFLPADLPRLDELALNPRVFLFALAASLITGLLFGVVPAWRTSRLDPALALRDTTRSSTASRGQNRLHSALVVGETALALMLLVGSGLLIRSFDRLMSVDTGFNPQHLVTFRVGMPATRYKDARLLQLTQQLQARFAAQPGVQQATYGYPLPLSGGDMTITFAVDGRPTSDADKPSARVSVVPANFFKAMQLPLVRGRTFTAVEDEPAGPHAIVVNQAFASRTFPGEDAVGKRIASDLSSDDSGKADFREIVGVVANVTRTSLNEEPVPEYFLPYGQVVVGPPAFALRVSGDPAGYVDTIRGVVAQQDASLPVYAVRTNLLARSTAQQNFQTTLITAFAGDCAGACGDRSVCGVELHGGATQA